MATITMWVIRTVILVLVLLAMGCTSFTVTFSDGTTIDSWGGVLVGRKDTFVVTNSRLDEATNTLYESRVERNTEEDVSAQQAAIQALVDMAKGAQAMNVAMFEAEMAAKAAAAAAAAQGHE